MTYAVSLIVRTYIISDYLPNLDLLSPIRDYTLSIPKDFIDAGASLWLVFLFVAVILCVLIYLWARREDGD